MSDCDTADGAGVPQQDESKRGQGSERWKRNYEDNQSFLRKKINFALFLWAVMRQNDNHRLGNLFSHLRTI